MTGSTTNSSSRNEGSLPKVGYWRRDLEGMRQRRLRAAELFQHGATQAEVARTLQVSRQAASVWHARLQAGGTTALAGAGRQGLWGAETRIRAASRGFVPSVEAVHALVDRPPTHRVGCANSCMAVSCWTGRGGLDPRRVLLAHSGDTTDADHLSEHADAGFLLGMDRFGIEIELPFADRVGIVVEMVRRGYAGQLVLSQDACGARKC
jgi:predicted metal-dependent phosphotriesterase family hydrolase